jgi:uncharacterized protein
MMSSVEPLFLSVDAGALGQRFALHHKPKGARARGLVVYVHPFAEEMNKSRRMAALQARALAQAGFAVLQIDLLGCGDSAGNFGDADWARWLADVVHACRWLQDEHGGDGGPAPPLWLWGLRAGCLLATEAAAQLDTPCKLLLWQPAHSGKLLLQQFLRLKAAGELLGGHGKAAMEQLRSDIAAGRSVEVAGYTLAASLCERLEQAQLQPPPRGDTAVWLETSTVESLALSPASEARLGAWRSAGWSVQAQAVSGPAFWQTTEIEDAPALLAATLAAVQACHPVERAA